MDNRRRIIEESTKLLITQGVKATTMDDIARYMYISKRTIYEHFQNKIELIISVLDYISANIEREQEEIFSHASNILEGFLEMVHVNRYSINNQEIKLMIDIRRYYPEVMANYCQSKQEEGIIRVEQLFEKGIEEEVFRKDLNPKTSAYMFSEQARLLFTELSDKIDIKIPGNSAAFATFNFMRDLFLNFLRGISTAKGIEIIEKFVAASLKSSNTVHLH